MNFPKKFQLIEMNFPKKLLKFWIIHKN